MQFAQVRLVSLITLQLGRAMSICLCLLYMFHRWRKGGGGMPPPPPPVEITLLTPCQPYTLPCTYVIV